MHLYRIVYCRQLIHVALNFCTEAISTDDLLPHLPRIDLRTQPRRKQERSTQLPVQAVSLPWGRCEPVGKHYRYLISDFFGDFRPWGAGTEGERLRGVGAERRCEEGHGADVRVGHYLTCISISREDAVYGA